jgi:hypothetical protein
MKVSKIGCSCSLLKRSLDVEIGLTLPTKGSYGGNGPRPNDPGSGAPGGRLGRMMRIYGQPGVPCKPLLGWVMRRTCDYRSPPALYSPT